MTSTLKWIVYLTIFLLIFLLLTYLGLSIASIYEQSYERKQLYGTITTQVSTISREGWGFIRPFFQLIVVLVIISWILEKFGINLQSKVFQFDWNVQSVIALVVIGAVTIAALGGITDGIGTLKDLALVVVGFYFGSQRKTVEIETPQGKASVTEVHENEVKIKEAPSKSESVDNA